MEFKIIESLNNFHLDEKDIFSYNNPYFGRGLINLKNIEILKFDIYRNESDIKCDKIDIKNNELIISHNACIPAYDFYNELEKKFIDESEHKIVRFGNYKYKVKRLDNLLIYSKNIKFLINNVVVEKEILFLKINNILINWDKLDYNWLLVRQNSDLELINNVTENDINRYNEQIYNTYNEMIQILNINNQRMREHVEGSKYFGARDVNNIR